MKRFVCFICAFMCLFVLSCNGGKVNLKLGNGFGCIEIGVEWNEQSQIAVNNTLKVCEGDDVSAKMAALETKTGGTIKGITFKPIATPDNLLKHVE